jgi:hypothetical protein
MRRGEWENGRIGEWENGRWGDGEKAGVVTPLYEVERGRG